MDQAANTPVAPAKILETDDLIFSEKMDAIAAAIVDAHGEIEKVVTTETADIRNDAGKTSYKYRYADLANVLAASKPALTKHGLAILQPPSTVTDERGATVVCVTTMLLHKSGQWCKSRLRMKPTQVSPQGVGSAITYARRYAAQAILGIAPEDDDGAGASQSALTGSAQAAAQNGQQKTAAPGAQQLRTMYKQARAVNPSLPEDIREWCTQHVEGFEAGKGLDERQSWFMFNTFKELLTVPDGQALPAQPPADAREQLEASLMRKLSDTEAKSLQIAFREHGFTTEGARHAFANEIVGKPSSKMMNLQDLQKMRAALNDEELVRTFFERQAQAL